MEYRSCRVRARTLEKIDTLQDFSVGTRIIIIQGEIAKIQGKIADLSNQIELDPANPYLKRLRSTLQDKEPS